jgi:transcriptional regulator with XRE-family HTH domain
METDIAVRLGKQIRLFRQKRGWKQIDLAVESEMSTNHISALERGEREICLLSLERVSVALGSTPSELLRSAGS